MIKKILTVLIPVLLISLALGASQYYKPHKNIVKAKPDIEMQAALLLQDFERDEAAANQKYLDKIIQVVGTVQEVKTVNTKSNIFLKTNSELSNVIFEFEEAISNIKQGQEIILKGICTGYLMDVVFVKSTIVNK